MIKVTFTLDDETVSYLNLVAERLSMPKSQVVRAAIRLYGEQAGRLSEEERDQMLDVFDAVTQAIPDRPRAEVEDELQRARDGRLESERPAGDRAP